MGTEQDQVRLIAERIARRVSENKGDIARDESADDVGGELAAMRASLKELQNRLAHIESHLTHNDQDRDSVKERSDRKSKQVMAAPQTRSPWLSGMYVPATHPSQERFGVNEAVVTELVDFFEGEKKCELEPGGKPCDHCAMCSSRGF